MYATCSTLQSAFIYYDFVWCSQQIRRGQGKCYYPHLTDEQVKAADGPELFP